MTSSTPGAWLRIARTDLAAARILLAVDGQTEAAACHVQQAAEKALKARLVYHRTVFPRGGGAGHDLSVLVRLLPAIDPVRVIAANVIDLTIWSTAWRYPQDDPATAEPVPSSADVAIRLETVAALIGAVAADLPDDSSGP